MKIMDFALIVQIAAGASQAVASPSPSPAVVAPVSPPVTTAWTNENSNPSTPVPLSNPAFWAMTSDYPLEALRMNEQGATGFAVQVNKLGLVSECRITSSSGSPRLDEATCRLVTQRGRFTPAKDRQGEPIAGVYANRVRWVLPETPPPEPGKLIMTYTVQPSGEVTDCKVVMEGGAAATMSRNAAFCSNTKKMKPYLDAENKPVMRKVAMTMTVTVD